MKKFKALILFAIISCNIFAQQIINNPKFSARTSENVQITRIELHNDFTKIDFKVEYFPKWWIKISKKKTYIQNSKGGPKLYVQRAEGIELDKQHFTPENGINIYTLYFPAIDKNTDKIDFMEHSWKFFDIQVNEKTVKDDMIPQKLRGNWLKVDGSNEWEYGFYKNKVIYKNYLWNNISLNKKGKKYILNLKNGSKSEQIIIQPKKDKLMIGSLRNNMQVYTRKNINNKNYKLKGEKSVQFPVFENDTAIYKGFINGYHPKMNNAIELYVDNILSDEQKSIKSKINIDGSFELKIPMLYPQNVYVEFLKRQTSVYLEPGKTLFHYIDLSEYFKYYKNMQEYAKRERKSLFAGELATVNRDLMLMDTIKYFNQRKVSDIILDMSGEEYKKYCIDIMKKEQKSLDDYIKNNTVSSKAVKIMKMEIPFRNFAHILSYNMNRKYAYRKKNNISTRQRDIPLEKETFKPEYYSFINANDLNKLTSLCTNSYNILINRMEYDRSLAPKTNYIFVAAKDSLKTAKAVISNEELILLNKLISCNSNSCTDSVMKSNSNIWKKFYKKHINLFNSIVKYLSLSYRISNMKKYYNLDCGLATDIMQSQHKYNIMVSAQKPLTDEEKNEIKQTITNEFIKKYILNISDDLQQSIDERKKANKTKTGYAINKTPTVEKEKLFDKIIEKYKGKFIYVDFWATWCSPCRKGIKEIAPLKEELQNENIVFIYITNESSPLKTWELLIPDIKGEHYRITGKEWVFITNKFHITSIPHYVFVDKSGKIINDNLHLDVDKLKLKFKEYLKK